MNDASSKQIVKKSSSGLCCVSPKKTSNKSPEVGHRYVSPTDESDLNENTNSDLENTNNSTLNNTKFSLSNSTTNVLNNSNSNNINDNNYSVLNQSQSNNSRNLQPAGLSTSDENNNSFSIGTSATQFSTTNNNYTSAFASVKKNSGCSESNTATVNNYSQNQNTLTKPNFRDSSNNNNMMKPSLEVSVEDDVEDDPRDEVAPLSGSGGGKKGKGKKGLAMQLDTQQEPSSPQSMMSISNGTGGMMTATNARGQGSSRAMSMNETGGRYQDQWRIQNKGYDYYIFDFDNVISCCMLGVRKNVSDECEKTEAYLRAKDTPDAAPVTFNPGTMVLADIENTTAKEFGGQERVNVLAELFGKLKDKNKKFWILSRGREARIKVALRNVSLLHYFYDDVINPPIQEMATISPSSSGGGKIIDFESGMDASKAHALGVVSMDVNALRHDKVSGAEQLSPDGGPSASPGGADNFSGPLSLNCSKADEFPDSFVSPHGSTPHNQGDVGAIFGAKSRILASDTLYRPKGLTKGDQIVNLLNQITENNPPPAEKALFLDDNLGNLELAEDGCTVYQPQAGANGIGLSLAELRYLIASLDQN